MLVRSQDNEKITDRIEFLIAEIPLNGEYGIYQPDHYRLFGRYSTMKKAIKALDILMKCYAGRLAVVLQKNETLYSAKIFTFPAEEEIPDEE